MTYRIHRHSFVGYFRPVKRTLVFTSFFFLKYVYLKIRQQVRVFYELAKWHPTLDSIPSFYEVKIYKKKIALFIKLEFTKEKFGLASNSVTT